MNSFDVCFLKKKRTLGEHVWHEGFEWHVLGMELGMNVSLICACFACFGLCCKLSFNLFNFGGEKASGPPRDLE